MTMAELFEAMPARLNTAAAAKVNKTIQWNITGDDPGVWAIQINDGAARLIPYGVEKPDVTFTVNSTDWLTIAEGKLNAMNAFMTGKLKIAAIWACYESPSAAPSRIVEQLSVQLS